MQASGGEGGAAVLGEDWVPAAGAEWNRTPQTEAEEQVATKIL